MIAGALAADLGFRLHAVHLYLVPNLLCIEQPLIEAAKKLGATYSSWPTHYLGRIKHYGVLCDADEEYPADLTEEQNESALRQNLGIDWIITGRRVSDYHQPGIVQTMRRLRGRYNDRRLCHGIWDWNLQDVKAAFDTNGVCRRRDISRPVPVGPSDAQGRGVGRGLNLFGRHLLWLWQACRGEIPGQPACRHTPTCWQRLCVSFPFAPGSVLRYLTHGPQVENLQHYRERGAWLRSDAPRLR